MSELNLEEHHKWCLEALRQLDKIFQDNHIPYYLIEGSALGAIRHSNIIPWDDDIDIGIYLKDRDRVSELLEKKLSSSFKWMDRRTVENHPRFFGKIVHNGQGCIDVFPLIKTSDRSIGRLIHWADRKIINKLYKAKINYANQVELKNIIGKLKTIGVRAISIFFSKKYVIQRMKNIEYKYENKEHNKYYFNLYGSYSQNKEIIKSEWIGEEYRISFGTGSYPIFKNYDMYLANLYGDYMTPPPEHQRGRHHEETFE